jgi:hypothetical protein
MPSSPHSYLNLLVDNDKSLSKENLLLSRACATKYSEQQSNEIQSLRWRRCAHDSLLQLSLQQGVMTRPFPADRHSEKDDNQDTDPLRNRPRCTSNAITDATMLGITNHFVQHFITPHLLHIFLSIKVTAFTI